jgi:hypothetical protein
MSFFLRRFAAAALAGSAVLVVAAPDVFAQRRVVPGTGNPLAQPITPITRTAMPAVLPFSNINGAPINPNFRIAPNLTLAQAAFNTALSGAAISMVPAWAFGYNPYVSPVLSTGPVFPGSGGINPALSTVGGGGFNPYGGGGGYGGAGTSALSTVGGGGYGGYGGYEQYGSDPYGISAYLRGAADVTAANGRYLSQVQQARLLQVQADNAKLDFRKRLADTLDYERNKVAAYNREEPVRTMQANLDVARRNPQANDVLSGAALNTLYNNLASQQRGGDRGQKVPLDEDTLRHINLRGAGSRGNMAMIKDDGKLNWPLALQGPEYEQARRRLSQLLPEAVRQLRFNHTVPAGELKDMTADVQRLNDQLERNVSELSPTQYVEAKRFVRGLSDALTALQDPNAPNYFNQAWVAQGTDVGSLVQYMKSKGLEFAPAGPSDGPAYYAMWRALANYDASMNPQVATRPEGGPPANTNTTPPAPQP